MLYWHGCPKCTQTVSISSALARICGFSRTGTTVVLAKIFRKFVFDVDKLPAWQCLNNTYLLGLTAVKGGSVNSDLMIIILAFLLK
jgi:hypothetical protein